MSIRRFFSTRRPSGDDAASQYSHAPTYRSFAEPSPSPPSYTPQQSNISSHPPQPSNQYQHLDPIFPPNQPSQSVGHATESSFDDSATSHGHDRRYAPSFMSGNSGEERFWQARADMSSINSIPSSPIPSAPAHRSVYYRVYSPDGLMPTKHSASSDDPSLGRTYAHFVPPPHTAATLKRHLVVREGIRKDIDSSLFLEISATVPLEDTAAVVILAESGAGSTPHEPLVLVLNESIPSNTIINEVPAQQPTNNIPAPPAPAELPIVQAVGPITSAQDRPPRPTGWIRVLAKDSYKRPSRGFISYQRGEILYASAWQELNDYGVTQRMATDLTLKRHGKIIMSFFTILKD